MKKILIFGSCVSRDIVSFQNSDEPVIELSGYFARSSFASAFASLKVDDIYTEKLSSPFQRRVVREDLGKHFKSVISQIPFDTLLIDFIDERFNLFQFKNGAICTLSSELLRTEFRKLNQKTGKVIRAGSAQYFALWEEGWERFTSLLRELHCIDKVIINKVYWASSESVRQNEGTTYTPKAISEANRMLDKLYARAERDLNASQFMTFTDEELSSAEDHQWGYAPFHYVDRFYASALERLSEQHDLFTDCFENKFKDTLQWNAPLFRFRDMRSALDSKFEQDGLYQINLGNKQVLDVYIQNSHLFEKSNCAVVSFSGAVANRSNKLGPFFSGLSITKRLPAPCIAISDPSLDINDALPLAWYAGNEKIGLLQQKIALLLDHIAQLHNAHLILFGGSGAGFASLTIQSYLNVKSQALVWNPQTVIEKYYHKFVLQYLRTGFPNSYPSFELQYKKKINDQEILFRNFFDNMGVVHSLSAVAPDKNKTIIYLQNRDDWHLEQHANPFLERFGKWDKLSEALYVNEPKNMYVVIGDWGEGHAAPDRNLVEALLSLCIESGFLTANSSLERGLVSIFDRLPVFQWRLADDQSIRLNIEIRRDLKHNSITATSFLINPSKSEPYTYAFYLLVNGNRVRSRWYEKNNSVTFDIKGIRGEIAIAAFVKDLSGNLLVEKKAA